jgi:HEAT repeat protein
VAARNDAQRRLVLISALAAVFLVWFCTWMVVYPYSWDPVGHWAAELDREADAARDRPPDHRGENGGGRVFVRKEAAQALSKFGPDAAAAVPALIRTLKSVHPLSPNAPNTMSVLATWDDSTAAAREALIRIGPAAVPALREALGDEDALTRVHAARALWDLRAAGPEEVLPVLWEAWADQKTFWTEDRIVRDEANVAIKQIRYKANAEVRLSVARALGARDWPPDRVDLDGLAELQKLATDPDEKVRAAAKASLEQIPESLRARIEAARARIEAAP